MGTEKANVSKVLHKEERVFMLREDGLGLQNVIASRSSEKKYSVTIWTANARGYRIGDVSCSCPAAVFSKSHVCYHIERVKALAVGTILKGVMQQREEALAALPRQETLPTIMEQTIHEPISVAMVIEEKPDEADERKPVLKLLGSDGNAFAILGKAGKAMKKAKWDDAKRDAVMKEMMAGSYDELLATATKYFDVN
jgi:hypothetical protein